MAHLSQDGEPLLWFWSLKNNHENNVKYNFQKKIKTMQVKVGKSQKQISLFSFFPKTEQKYVFRSNFSMARTELGKYFVHFLEEIRTRARSVISGS